jgi:hypothetical protein
VNLNTLRTKTAAKNNSFNLSQGLLKVFSPYYDWPVLQLHAPQVDGTNHDSNWIAFCLIGDQGLRGIYPLNNISKDHPNVLTTCNDVQSRSV